MKTPRKCLKTYLNRPQHPPQSPPPSSFFYWPFQGCSSVAVFLCESVVSYVTFVLVLFVPHLSFSWCLVKVVLRACGISWVASYLFLYTENWAKYRLVLRRHLCVIIQMQFMQICFSVVLNTVDSRYLEFQGTL